MKNQDTIESTAAVSVGSDALDSSSFEIVEVADGIHHGVRDGITLYRIWPTPMSRKRYAACYFPNGNIVGGAEADTLGEMGQILRARCC